MGTRKKKKRQTEQAQLEAARKQGTQEQGANVADALFKTECLNVLWRFNTYQVMEKINKWDIHIR